MVSMWLFLAAVALAAIATAGWLLERWRAQDVVDRILDGELAPPRLDTARHSRPDGQ
jgi:hypothetical protein